MKTKASTVLKATQELRKTRETEGKTGEKCRRDGSSIGPAKNRTAKRVGRPLPHDFMWGGRTGVKWNTPAGWSRTQSATQLFDHFTVWTCPQILWANNTATILQPHQKKNPGRAPSVFTYGAPEEREAEGAVGVLNKSEAL